MSPCHKRNAISSSYSSTGGFPSQRRRGPDSSHCQETLSSSKKVSEDNSQAVSQAAIHAQGEKAADAPPGEKLAPRNGSPTSQESRPCRRKFPLLPRRRGEPLMLPPPLQLGFQVTAEDLDLEKEAALRCINSALRGEAKVIWDCRGPEGTRDAQSAFRPLRDNGDPLPLVPRPGPLQRDLHAQSSEVRYEQRSQPSKMSPCPKRNAISSSYSSTGGFPWLKKKTGPDSSHCHVTRSEVIYDKKSQPSGRGLRPKQNAISSSYSSTGGFPWLKRRRGPDSSNCHVTLSSSQTLGYWVTAEDMDLEKEAARRCINSALRGEA
ncbi:hypothetical protein P7K49_002603 [Saguinus oedipus]|uniref:Uncharacterized protein n=1 Tax=Saguinus oedipus TaxID=9490 RepID=A0ABQ9WHT1_SAGOE|nr:hypothetical protein P7K49_002603 [Saguinus oedipus]